MFYRALPSLRLYVGNLQVLWGLLGPAWGCMLATYRSYGACWAQLGAVCWQPTVLMGLVGPSLGLYIGNLHVIWGLLDPAWGLYIGNLHVIWGLLDPAWGLYVGNLHVLCGLLDPAWSCMLATYRSHGACCTQLGAVCWQPAGLMRLVGPSLGLYIGNLQVLWGLLDPAWGCMLATYGSYGACWTQLGAVCWQPTGLMGLVGPSLGLYVGNLQVLWELVGPSLGLYGGNLPVLLGLLDPAWGCMLATYRSYGACWTQLGAVCWQPTGLMGLVGPSLGLYVGNLHVSWGLLDPAWDCMLATYRSYGACWTQLGLVCWQSTGLMGLVGPSLGLYVGNLQVLWGLLDPAWGCILATYRSYGACWAQFGGCMLATYRSYGACWTQLGTVCWQPTGLMGLVGPSLGLYVGNLHVLCQSYVACWALYVGNLHVLWGLLDPAWGCMLATYRSYAACWNQLGAVCWQPTGLIWLVGPSFEPTGLMGLVGPSLGLLDPAGGCMLQVLWWLLDPALNLQVLWGFLDPAWGCWQPTGLMRLVGPSLGLYVGNLHVLWGLLGPALNLQVFWGWLDPAWGCM